MVFGSTSLTAVEVVQRPLRDCGRHNDSSRRNIQCQPGAFLYDTQATSTRMFRIAWTAPGGNNGISGCTFAGTNTPAEANNYCKPGSLLITASCSCLGRRGIHVNNVLSRTTPLSRFRSEPLPDRIRRKAKPFIVSWHESSARLGRQADASDAIRVNRSGTKRSLFDLVRTRFHTSQTGYIFARLHLATQSFEVRYMPRVTGFVSSGCEPLPSRRQ